MELTVEQMQELRRLKSYYPFRIVFAVIDKDTKQFSAYCQKTMHVANRMAREGHEVAIYNR